MSVGRMPGYKVKNNADFLFVSRVEKVYKVGVCAVSRRYLLVVADIIACVLER